MWSGTVALAAVAGVVVAAHASSGADGHSANMSLAFTSPTANVNSDLAFWGKRAYVANYGGFRIFDISRPAARRRRAPALAVLIGRRPVTAQETSR